MRIGYQGRIMKRGDYAKALLDGADSDQVEAIVLEIKRAIPEPQCRNVLAYMAKETGRSFDLGTFSNGVAANY